MLIFGNRSKLPSDVEILRMDLRLVYRLSGLGVVRDTYFADCRLSHLSVVPGPETSRALACALRGRARALHQALESSSRSSPMRKTKRAQGNLTLPAFGLQGEKDMSHADSADSSETVGMPIPTRASNKVRQHESLNSEAATTSRTVAVVWFSGLANPVTVSFPLVYCCVIFCCTDLYSKPALQTNSWRYSLHIRKPVVETG